MPDTAARPLHLIIAAQYFLYFGVLGLYLPYFNLYCYHLGFDGVQIGSLAALRSLTLVVFPLVWGIIADRYHCRRPLYVVCTILSALVWGGYLLTTDYHWMLLITFCYGALHAPIISFLEAFTMDILGAEKKKYGRIRVWGSISFILVVVLLGKVIDLTDIRLIIHLILVGALLLAAMALRVPPVQTSQPVYASSNPAALANGRVMVFLTCGFLMLASHGAYYGFFSIHLETLGYSKTFIGISWALASTAEIWVMVNSHRLFKRFAIEQVLVFSFLVAALRWVLLYFAESAPSILASQLLHAITYGTFHMASILYIDQLSDRQNKTLGQAVNNAVQYGLGLMVGIWISGLLYETIGSHALFAISAAVALVGGVVFKVSVRMNPAVG